MAASSFNPMECRCDRPTKPQADPLKALTCPIERTCRVDVEVIAGETSTVVITDIPVGDGPCPLAGS